MYVYAFCIYNYSSTHHIMYIHLYIYLHTTYTPHLHLALRLRILVLQEQQHHLHEPCAQHGRHAPVVLVGHTAQGVERGALGVPREAREARGDQRDDLLLQVLAKGLGLGRELKEAMKCYEML